MARCCCFFEFWRLGCGSPAEDPLELVEFTEDDVLPGVHIRGDADPSPAPLPERFCDWPRAASDDEAGRLPPAASVEPAGRLPPTTPCRHTEQGREGECPGATVARWPTDDRPVHARCGAMAHHGQSTDSHSTRGTRPKAANRVSDACIDCGSQPTLACTRLAPNGGNSGVGCMHRGDRVRLRTRLAAEFVECSASPAPDSCPPAGAPVPGADFFVLSCRGC